MTVEHLKSTPITNLDATPIVENTTGEGGPGFLRHIAGTATPSAAASVGSTYQMVRLASNSKVKSVVFESAAQGSGAMSLSVYYSDSTQDGTSVGNQGVIVPTTGAAFFASQINCASAVTRASYTNQSGNYTADKRNKPLWAALGLSSDPGGYFDIVAVVDTTAVTTGTGLMGLECEFVI